MEALPIGHITIMNDSGVPRRFIKVSHHGNWRRRWRPLARHRWESQVGPIPDGYRVEFRDSHSLHDDLENLILTRSNRFKLLLERPRAKHNQQVKRRSALRKSNRDRTRVADSQLRPTAWYVVLPLSKAFIWVPCRTRIQARDMFSEFALVNLCERNRFLIEFRDLRSRGAIPFEPGHPIQILRGSQIAAQSGHDGACEGFIRLIPDTRKPPKNRKKPLFDTQFVADSGPSLGFDGPIVNTIPRMAEYV